MLHFWLTMDSRLDTQTGLPGHVLPGSGMVYIRASVFMIWFVVEVCIAHGARLCGPVTPQGERERKRESVLFKHVLAVVLWRCL